MRHVHVVDGKDSAYFNRIQIAVICSLLLFIALFRLWPDGSGVDRRLDGRFDEDPLFMPKFIETRQQPSVERSAPRVPRPAVVVPDEEVVDVEFDLEITGLDVDVEIGPIPMPQGPGEVVAHPDRPPNVRRIVEPVTPQQARRDGIRVELVVRYVVSERGEVEEAEIDEIRIFNRETGLFEVVSDTGYGFREITLEAARQWLFTPAEHQGKPVRSTVRHRFTFGN